MKILFTITFAMLYALSLSANTDKDIIEFASELDDCLQRNLDELEAQTPPKNGVSDAKKMAVSSLRLYVLPSLKTKKYHDALNYLNRIAASISDEHCLELVARLQEKISEIEKKNLAEIESAVKALREKIKNTLPKTTSAEELDPLFEDIEDIYVQTKGIRNNPFRERTEVMRNIVSKWQTYLAYYNVGEVKQAGSELRSITSLLERTPILPRSIVIEMDLKLKGLQASNLKGVKTNNTSSNIPKITADSIISRIRSIDDIEESKLELSKLLSTHQKLNAKRALENVEKIEQSQSLINNGDPLLALGLLNSLKAEWAADIKNQLMLDAIKEATPEGYKKLVQTESISGMIDQVALEMKSKKDWINLWEYLKIITTYLDSNKYSPKETFPTLNNDTVALGKFIHATKLQASGQLTKSLSTYTSVLYYTGRYGPYEDAMLAIETLRERYAEELYADQKKLAETPSKPISVSDQRHNRFLSMHRLSPKDQAAIMEDIERMIESKVSIYLANQNKAKQVRRANDEKPKTDAQ